jgi:hypothetical protein
MMFSFKTCHFVLLSLLSLSANAETIRGAQRELIITTVATVDLGVAAEYAILSKTGISTVPASTITGNIAVSPAAATYITGFGLSLDPTTQYSTTPQVNGQAHAASYGAPISVTLTTAVSNMLTAYNDAAGRLNMDETKLNLGTGILGGAFGGPSNPLTPGIYTFFSDVTITTDITFADANDLAEVFIIQINGNLNVDSSVILAGALAKNIFWQVSGEVIVAEGATLEGILLVKSKVTFKKGSTLHGRVLTDTFCALDQATITEPTL